MSVTRAITGLAAASLLLAGCGEDYEGDDEGAADPSPSMIETAEAGGAPDLASVNTNFQPYADDADAVTYDEKAVPPGSSVTVNVTRDQAETDFSLAVSGLEPEETYGAHLHVDPCGEDPAAAGGHYQHEPAPEGKKHDPEYVNKENEVWLDFTTSADGTATAQSSVAWRPSGHGETRSVVIHSDHTKTEPGMAGEAGTRLACVNVPL